MLPILRYLMPAAALIFAAASAACGDSSDDDEPSVSSSAGSSGSASAGEAGSGGGALAGEGGSASAGEAGSGGGTQAGEGGSANPGEGGSASAGEAGSGSNAGEGGGNVDEPATMQGITAAHNAIRGAVNPLASPPITPLSWTPSLAMEAQTWADKCNFTHSKGPHGENIFASAGSSPNPQKVVESWASEAKNYNYATNQCSGNCGHYTQVVWATSTHLGCGYAHCTSQSPFSGFSEWDLWVCNYDPPGNYPERPYCTVEQTSGCSK